MFCGYHCVTRHGYVKDGSVQTFQLELDIILVNVLNCCQQPRSQFCGDSDIFLKLDFQCLFGDHFQCLNTFVYFFIM